MKMDLSCARADMAIGPAATTMASMAIRNIFSLMVPSSGVVRERPQAQFLLRDLPEPRQALWLYDQKKDDEPTEDHQLDLLLERDGQLESHGVGRVGEEDRH